MSINDNYFDLRDAPLLPTKSSHLKTSAPQSIQILSTFVRITRKLVCGHRSVPIFWLFLRVIDFNKIAYTCAVYQCRHAYKATDAIIIIKGILLITGFHIQFSLFATRRRLISSGTWRLPVSGRHLVLVSSISLCPNSKVCNGLISLWIMPIYISCMGHRRRIIFTWTYMTPYRDHVRISHMQWCI